MSGEIKSGLARNLILVAAVALIFRLTYFFLMLSNLGIEGSFTSIHDTSIYWIVVKNFSEPSPLGQYWLFQVGPGYAALLFSIYKISLGSHYALYFAHILFGVLGVVLVYLIAYHLFENKAVALLAGLLNGISFTSITLSCNILSDQPFFTFFAASFLLLIIGLQKNNYHYYLLSGLLGGASALIRGVAVLWPILLIIILALLIRFFRTSPMRVNSKIAFIAPLIMLIMIQGLSFYNYMHHDIYAFGGNGMRAARIRLAALTVSRSENISYNETIESWYQKDSVAFNYQIPQPRTDYLYNKDWFLSILKEHPVAMAKTYMGNVSDNITVGNYIPLAQIPSMTPLWDRLIAISRKWINHLLVVLTLIGLVVMAQSHKFVQAIFLGSIYLYFTMITGFSFWQGSRLHYPAEIAWVIILSFLFCHTFKAIKRRWGRL